VRIVTFVDETFQSSVIKTYGGMNTPVCPQRLADRLFVSIISKLFGGPPMVGRYLGEPYEVFLRVNVAFVVRRFCHQFLPLGVHPVTFRLATSLIFEAMLSLDDFAACPKSLERLAGAPGFEPGNGGIKIRWLSWPLTRSRSRSILHGRRTSLNIISCCGAASWSFENILPQLANHFVRQKRDKILRRSSKPLSLWRSREDSNL
jgi:hypothetical protein